MGSSIVIQGVSDPSPLLLDHLIQLTGCSSHTRIADRPAWRFNAGKSSNALQAFCLQHQLDCSSIPTDQCLDRFGLFAFDMDSTLINIECIDELAKLAGISEQIIPITERAMQGKIDFASSFLQRIALLSNLPESALDTVYEQKLRLNPGTEILIAELQRRGIKTMLITSGFEYFAERLKSQLRLDQAVFNRVEISQGFLTGKTSGKLLDAEGKAKALENYRITLGLRQEQVVAIGDGANDLAMLGKAGVSIAYHAKQIVREQATHTLDFVGLDGAINLFESSSPCRN